MKFFLLVLVGMLSTAAFTQDTIPAGKLTEAGWVAVTNRNLKKSKQYKSISFAVEIDSVGNLLQTTIIKDEVKNEALVQKCLAEIYKMDFVKSNSDTSGNSTSKGILPLHSKK